MKNILFKCCGLFAVTSLLLLNSCADSSVSDSAPSTSTGGKLKIEFDNVVGDKNLVLN